MYVCMYVYICIYMYSCIHDVYILYTGHNRVSVY